MVRPLFVALGLVLATSCRRSSPPPPEADPARRAEDGGEAPAPAAKPVPAGSQLIGPRTIEVALYTPGPVGATLTKTARDLLVQRFPGVTLTSDPKQAAPAMVVLTPGIETYAPPDGAQLDNFGRGLDDAQKKAVVASRGALVMTWFLDADPERKRTQAAYAAVLELAGGTRFVWDETSREVFTAAAFRERRVDTCAATKPCAGWQGAIPDVRKHIVLHFYETGARHRAVTLGLGPLGAPDLVVQDVAPAVSAGMGTLVDVVAQRLVEGQSVGEGGELAVSLDAIVHAAARDDYVKGLGAGAKRKLTVRLVEASPEEGDAHNRLVELRFDRQPGATEPERQAAAVKALLGATKDELAHAPDKDPELEAVRVRVQARLPAVAVAFRKGLPVGDQVSVKAPFATDEGSTEWMWIDVTGWDGEVVKGTLDNEPFYVKSLAIGAKVEVKQASIADYLWVHADGKREGGESSAILERRERAKR